MNKRIKSKTLKKTNSSRHKKILNEISQHFTIKRLEYADGYFLFNFGDKAVCYFSLKDTPDWEFGIWLFEDKFQIFGEHVDLIDKFKPSRTYVSHDNDLNGFIEEVKNIRDNPKLYFVDSYTGNALVAYEEKTFEGDDDIYYSGYQVVREFNEETKLWDIIKKDESITQEDYVNKEYEEYQKEKMERIENEKNDRIYAFNFFNELPNLFEEVLAVGIHDCNKGGLSCSPRYDIKVVLNPDLTQDAFDKLYDELYDLIREKNYSKEKTTYEHQFSLFGCFDELSDIKNCDYKFLKVAN